MFSFQFYFFVCVFVVCLSLTFTRYLFTTSFCFVLLIFVFQYTTWYTTGAKHFGKESSRVLHDFCFWFTCLQQLKYSLLAFVYNFFLDVLALSKERMKETEAFFYY
uniref:(northern house mosquito) hypothetical protein n=1 Tax=Culex pipiens TaxID=7175 RepID=A0A8D8AR20_CULPI